MYSHAGHTWQHNTAPALCMLDNYGYRRTLIICNTYCFSTATLVVRTRLNVTLYVHRYIASVVFQSCDASCFGRYSWT
jgi:hypothetical protein